MPSQYLSPNDLLVYGLGDCTNRSGSNSSINNDRCLSNETGRIGVGSGLSRPTLLHAGIDAGTYI